MKRRTSLVSNSSSSSFVVPLHDLSPQQIEWIKEHISEGEKWDIHARLEDAWYIEDTGRILRGDCFMDNFDMRKFMERIGVDMSKVEWDHS